MVLLGQVVALNTSFELASLLPLYIPVCYPSLSPHHLSHPPSLLVSLTASTSIGVEYHLIHTFGGGHIPFPYFATFPF